VLELRLLGPAQFAGSNGQDVDALTRQPKRTALLAYLAIARPRALHRRDKLLALFWPELDEPHARNALSQALYVLRSALGDGAIVTRGDDEVGIASDAVRSDVSEFEAALDAGRQQDALQLYRGDLLDGFFVSSAPDFERWLESERARLRQRASEGGWALARSKAKSGDVLAAERHARWAAVRAYEDFARKFADEYDLQPSAETQALATKIRRDVKPNVKIGREVEEQQRADPESRKASIDQESVKPPVLGTRRRWSRTLIAVVMLVGVAGIAIAFDHNSRPADKLGDRRDVPRLVVLPLTNLGPAENAYFAAGVSDEITTRLAMLTGLNVVGGAAAERYKEAASGEKSRPDGVPADYFLEGTASWLPAPGGGHIRVRLQLANARDGTALWGAIVEEDIGETTKLFALYSSIAQRVVDQLDLVLETPRHSVSTASPTTSLEAYNDYLRGRDYMRRTSTAVNWRAALQMLERAVQRDTSFALAFALLASAHTEAVWQVGMNLAHYDSAKAAGERALRLDPNLPEAHTFMGAYYYACCEDYERAMWHLTRSRAIRPGDAQAVMRIGNVHKRQGRWAESIRDYEEAARLDPLARWPQNNKAHAQMWSRRYDDAERTFRRVLAYEPQDIFAYAHLAWLLVLRDGNIDSARTIVRDAARSSDGYAEMRVPYYLELLDRKYDAALAALTPPEPGLTASLLNEWLVSDGIRRALVLRLRGDSAAAHAQFDSARAELESVLGDQSPESRRVQLWLRGGLAIAYAGLGRRADAMKQVNFVLASDPLKVDAIEGPKYLQHVALAYVLLGDRARAIDVLERLLSVGAPVSSQSLRLEPFWDALRSEPRFVRMVGANR
jgi:DNA-binding SARP family transcriptional activator/TolB-like protein/Flp pilus assembly protein TadD